MHTANEYLKSRTKDAISLSHEIQESKGKLGYVTIINPCELVTSKGESKSFNSPAELRVFILKTYW